MKTLEASYIFPIIFAITAFSIIFTFKIHDKVISKPIRYGILIDQAASLENDFYATQKGYTKNEISNLINDLSFINNNTSFSACLSGNVLYLHDDSRSYDAPTFFSNYERCDTIRKETALILQYIKK